MPLRCEWFAPLHCEWYWWGLFLDAVRSNDGHLPAVCLPRFDGDGAVNIRAVVPFMGTGSGIATIVMDALSGAGRRSRLADDTVGYVPGVETSNASKYASTRS